MSCGVGLRGGSDPTLLWLWFRAAAVAQIQPLTWEHPCAVVAALKKKKKEKRKKKKRSIFREIKILFRLSNGA